jgi:hypothetical protein
MKIFSRFVLTKTIPFLFILIYLIISQHEFRVQLSILLSLFFGAETLIFWVIGEIERIKEEKMREKKHE